MRIAIFNKVGYNKNMNLKELLKAQGSSKWDTWTWHKWKLRGVRGNKCEVCGGEKGLSLHHSLPKSKFPELVFEMWNLVLVCSDCHYKLDRLTPPVTRLF